MTFKIINIASWKYINMKILYIIVLSLPLMNGLVNNTTGTCQCICQKPYLGEYPGNNLSDIVKKSLKYFMETKNIVSIFLNLWIYVGFHSCLHKWCLQSGTNQQYTKCERVSGDGRTCYNPTIKYGSTIGGYPTKHKNNNYKQWCQQLFPTSNIMKSSVTQCLHRCTFKPTNSIGELFWCSQYDESVPHWCDRADGHWKDSTLDQIAGYPIIDSLTCQI